jgi:hypothetical protein
VQAAKTFVRDLCLSPLTPKQLERLAKLYRPPLFPGTKRGKRRAVDNAERPTLPRLLLVQLHREVWNDREQSVHDAGLPVAKKRRKHPRSYEQDSFIYSGRCPFQEGDAVIRVMNEGGGHRLVTTSANALQSLYKGGRARSR